MKSPRENAGLQLQTELRLKWEARSQATLPSYPIEFKWLHMELAQLARVIRSQGRVVELVREGTFAVMRISHNGTVMRLPTWDPGSLTIR